MMRLAVRACSFRRCHSARPSSVEAFVAGAGRSGRLPLAPIMSRWASNWRAVTSEATSSSSRTIAWRGPTCASSGSRRYPDPSGPGSGWKPSVASRSLAPCTGPRHSSKRWLEVFRRRYLGTVGEATMRASTSLRSCTAGSSRRSSVSNRRWAVAGRPWMEAFSTSASRGPDCPSPSARALRSKWSSHASSSFCAASWCSTHRALRPSRSRSRGASWGKSTEPGASTQPMEVRNRAPPFACHTLE
mmetsp:Transcript_102271/g.176595  ORF Transcript_102271/g.176595 Transcript_102271/m.176595 type:complete len:245 (-) Transcript_102271:188-922(-)